MDGKGADEAAGCCMDMADAKGTVGAGADVAAAALLKLKAPPPPEPAYALICMEQIG